MDKMPIKTTQKIATESFSTLRDGRFKLLGTDVLKTQFGPRSEFRTFYDVFGLGCRFYYYAQHTCTRDLTNAELGICFLQKNKNNFYLKRTKKLLQLVDGEYLDPDISNYCHFQNLRGDDCLTVSSYIPTTISHILIEPNSLIYSSAPAIPCSIQLDNNSLLVCLDNQLQSMTFKEFARRLHEYT